MTLKLMAEQTRATYEARIWDCKDMINREAVGGGTSGIQRSEADAQSGVDQSPCAHLIN